MAASTLLSNPTGTELAQTKLIQSANRNTVESNTCGVTNKRRKEPGLRKN
jgi:hypothetical protein